MHLGCPAMGDEVLDEGEMEPFVEDYSVPFPARRSVFSDPMTGAMDSGCVIGRQE